MALNLLSLGVRERSFSDGYRFDLLFIKKRDLFTVRIFDPDIRKALKLLYPFIGKKARGICFLNHFVCAFYRIDPCIAIGYSFGIFEHLDLFHKARYIDLALDDAPQCSQPVGLIEHFKRNDQLTDIVQPDAHKICIPLVFRKGPFITGLF